MATKKELCRSSTGVFVRNLGWKLVSPVAIGSTSSTSDEMNLRPSLRVCAWNNSGSKYACGTSERTATSWIPRVDRFGIK